MARKHELEKTKDYGDCVIEARLQSGLSKTKFAERLGVDNFTLKIIERRSVGVSPKQLVKIFSKKVRDKA